MIFKLIADLYNCDNRHMAAQKLAQCFDASYLIIFIKDLEINKYLPGLGFTQTLYGGHHWDNFLENASQQHHTGKLSFPDKESMIDAVGFPGPDESVVVLLGTKQLSPQIDSLMQLLPLVVALLKQEQAVIATRSLAFNAEKEALKAEKLYCKLDVATQNLRKSLMEQQKDKEEIKRLMQKKDEFMNIASHELKTPITSMKAYLQMVSYKLLPVIQDKQLRSFIEKSNKQVDKLASLINDLLDVSKIQAGKMTYAFTTFSFSETIKEAVDEVVNTTAEHKITVNNTLKDEILFRGDKLRIEQVLVNLISNAIKYSPKSDEVTLDVMSEGNCIKVSVTDLGIGISEKQLPYIFDRFFRVENEGNRFFGLGLGLFISAEIIKRHRGEIGVESRLNEGSRFWFKLPLDNDNH